MASTKSNPSLRDALDHRQNAGGRASQPPAKPTAPAPSPAPSRPASPEPQRGWFAGLSGTQKALGGVALGGLVALAVLAVTSRKANASTLPHGSGNPSSSIQGGGGGGGGGSADNGGGGGGGGSTSGLHTSEQSLTPDQISHYKRILLGLGYTGLNADTAGTIGTYTRIALGAFQRAYNADNAAIQRGGSTPNGRTELYQPVSISTDGVLGPQTRAALDHYASYEAYRG